MATMIRNTSTLVCATLLAGLLGAATSAQAAQVAGITLSPTETVQGHQLLLTGCGVREELWMDLYAVSLYLPQGTAAEASRIRDSSVPKLLQLDVTYDGSVPNGLPDDWAQRLREQVSREFIRTLQNQYNDLKYGDTVRIAYVPNGGTTLSVNGRVVTTRPGSGLMDAMLDLWIGTDPISSNLKRLLLSGSCG